MPAAAQAGRAAPRERPPTRTAPAAVSPSRPTRSRPDRGFRRTLAWGLTASVLLHLALALAWRGAALPAPSPGPDRAASVSPTPGGALQAVSVRRAAPVEVPRRPAPVRAAEDPDLRPPRVSEAGVAAGELERPAPGPAPEGGASGGPGGGVVRPPVPRSVLPEWDAPSEVRGRTVTVRVHVDSAGRPTGLVELVPRTSHEGFNGRLVRKARAMRFAPARDGRGRPVAAWAELTFSF